MLIVAARGGGRRREARRQLATRGDLAALEASSSAANGAAATGPQGDDATRAQTMIEKTATRVLDAGATIIRQSGRGRLLVVKGPDRGESIAIADAGIHARLGQRLRRAALRPDHLAPAPRHRARAGGRRRCATSARPTARSCRARASRADARLRHRGHDRQDGPQVRAQRGGGRPGAVRRGELRLAGRARPQAAPAVPPARRRRRHRRHGADRGRDRHRQGAVRRGDPPPQPAQATARSSCSTAAPCPTS